MDVNEIDYQLIEFLNINKPIGWTSFDVVKKIRSLSKIKKVGHAGTLDPFASGVLVLALGRATKKISEIQALEKEYIGEVELGVVTDTLDVTGEIIERHPVDVISQSQVEAVLSQFIGIVEQIPPAYSALKINGVRAYKLARKGKKVEMKPRQVHIHSIDILEFSPPVIKIRVRCEKGTYVRALARDIGAKLGTGGYLRTLTRTRVGYFHLEDALEIESLAPVKNLHT